MNQRIADSRDQSAGKPALREDWPRVERPQFGPWCRTRYSVSTKIGDDQATSPSRVGSSSLKLWITRR